MTRNRDHDAAAGTSRGYAIARLPRRRRLGSESGQTVVEFAMVLPLLCLLVFAMIDFGKGLYYYIELTHVANEGARIATVNPASLPGGSVSLGGYLCGQLGSGTSELRKGSSSTDKATVSVSYPASSQGIGDPVKVEVATTYHWIPFVGGTMKIAGSATMRLEQSTAGNTLLSGGTCS